MSLADALLVGFSLSLTDALLGGILMWMDTTRYNRGKQHTMGLFSSTPNLFGYGSNFIHCIQEKTIAVAFQRQFSSQPETAVPVLQPMTSRRHWALRVIGLVNAQLAIATSSDEDLLKPSILFILTDDLDMGEVAYMPILQQQLIQKGVTFTNNLVNTPLCCPSRTSILRGQYSHNTGVQTNQGTNGGFATAHSNGLEASTVATWLQDAGYRTALIGKYLNGYPKTTSNTYVPPGWTEFYSPVKGTPYSQYNYTLNENGHLVSYGDAPRDYGTKVYVKKAQEFMTRAAAAGQPFFAFISMYAPHLPAMPDPRDVNAFPGATAPRTPNFNEADVSDKPAWVQAFPLLTDSQRTSIDNVYRTRAQSTKGVDRAIGQLIATLSANGQLSSTYIVFCSDNGFHFGQHRLLNGKSTVYEEDVRVPLIVRGPGVPKHVTRAHVTGNIDLAPTFADLAGALTPEFVDGRSFLPLLRSGPPSVSSWRRAYLIEHWLTTVDSAPPAPDDPPSNPEFHALRTTRYTYLELVTGEKELYDHRVDPYELDNIASTASPSLLTRMHTQLEALKVCSAAACRTAES